MKWAAQQLTNLETDRTDNVRTDLTIGRTLRQATNKADLNTGRPIQQASTVDAVNNSSDSPRQHDRSQSRDRESLIDSGDREVNEINQSINDKDIKPDNRQVGSCIRDSRDSQQNDLDS